MILYRLLALVARFALGIFFRRIEVEGRERVPPSGPILFVANHPNTVIDGLLLGTFHRAKIHFLAKGVLFENRYLARFLSTFGVIPVYRQQDAADMSKNQESFGRCHEVLEKGGTICLFPEGTSVTEPRLLRFKTGAARIALGAEEKNGFELGVRIVPIALAYDEKTTFRSRVLLKVAPPIDARDWRSAYLVSPQDAVRELTERLEAAFRDLLPQADDWRELQSIDRVRRLYQEELGRRHDVDPALLEPTLASRVRLTKAFLEGYSYFKEKDPRAVQALRSKVDRYFEMLELAGVPPGALGQRVSTSRAILFLLSYGAGVIVGFPLFLLGAAHSYPPFLLVRLLVQKANPESEYVSSYKLLIGLVVYPFFHIAAAILYGVFVHPAAVAASLVTTPLAGLFALHYWPYARRFALGIAAFFRNRGRIRASLGRRRVQLLEEVGALVRTYEKVRGGEPQESSP